MPAARLSRLPAIVLRHLHIDDDGEEDDERDESPEGASNICLPLRERFADSVLELLGGGAHVAQRRHHRLRGVAGDRADLGERLGLDVGDARLRLRQARVARSASIDGSLRRRGGLGLLAGAVGDAIGVAAGLGQRLLVGAACAASDLDLQRFGRIEIAGDAPLAVGEDAGDARQRQLASSG